MAGRVQRAIDQIPPPKYGLNDLFDPTAISDFQAVAMENISLVTNVAESRRGYTQFGATSGSGPIQSGYDYRKSDGTVHMMRARQGAIERYNTATDTWVAITLPITLTANLKVSFATLNDLLIISNGVDSDLTWDGNTSNAAVERASNPKADVQIIFQNRTVKFKFSNSRYYYSDINDPTVFDALSFVQIDPNNAALGTGIAEISGQIAVFKENKAYIVSSLIGGAIYPLEGNLSAVGHYSIASTGRSLIFLSTRGWCELEGQSIRLISGHINIANLEASRLRYAHAEFYDFKYRCFVTESGYGYNNLEFVIYTDRLTPFSEQKYPITKNRGLNGNCYIKTNRSGKEELYFGDSRPDSGSPATSYSKVYKMFDGANDDGEVIHAFWDSKQFSQNVPFYEKRYRRIYTRVVNQTGLTVYVAYRFGTNDAWTETALDIPETLLSWEMDTGDPIENWLEDYGWPFEGSEDAFTSIATSGRPRTIQFRNRISESAVRCRWLYQAYEYRIKRKFR